MYMYICVYIYIYIYIYMKVEGLSHQHSPTNACILRNE